MMDYDVRHWVARANDETWMQAVAREMNLSETAFLVRQEDGFGLRWFTPATTE
jgi:predicted PhzF superfamily epimerase YddE/YHI9